MTDIEGVLKEREGRYGAFEGHAKIAQGIKRAMQDSLNWTSLPAPMKEALEMTAHKIARILNGDPSYKDSWDDIAGYVLLVAKELKD